MVPLGDTVLSSIRRAFGARVPPRTTTADGGEGGWTLFGSNGVTLQFARERSHAGNAIEDGVRHKLPR